MWHVLNLRDMPRQCLKSLSAHKGVILRTEGSRGPRQAGEQGGAARSRSGGKRMESRWRSALAEGCRAGGRQVGGSLAEQDLGRQLGGFEDEGAAGPLTRVRRIR